MEENKEIEKDKNSIQEKSLRDIRRYIIGIIILIIIILLLCVKCGCERKKYKIKIHNGDEIIEVDDNFKLSDLDVEGGIVSFLVDSDGHIVDPSEKLDPSKEYSVHIIPDGKEKVKVTYINGSWKKTFDYLKGSGLLFPKDPIKEGYVFLGWKNEEKGIYPKYMDPVNEDMTLVAQFGKSEFKDGVCTLNCDTNKDGVCDLNCDKDGDGKPDSNIDTNGDGKCDLNCDVDGDGKCDYKCDTDGDGKCDLNCESSNSKMEYTYGEGNVTFSCQSTGFSLFMSKSTELVETKIDGVVVDPDEWNMDANSEQKYAHWNKSISKYFKSGKTVDLISTLIKKDDNDQKYYKISTIKLIFPSKDECDAKPNNCADTNEDGKCDENLLLITDDYDIEVGCKVGVAHRQTKKGVLVSSTINGEEVKPDEILDTPESKYKWPTWYLTKYNEKGEPIELIVKGFDYNENGEKYEYAYTSHISFTEKCTNLDETPVPEPEPKPEPKPESKPQPKPEPKVTYTCPNGYTLSGTKCNKQVTDTKDAKISGYSCENGYTLGSDNKCRKDVEPTCPSGYTDGPNSCEKITTKNVSYSCHNPYIYAYGKCCFNNTDGDVFDNCPGRENPQAYCENGQNPQNGKCTVYEYARKDCYNGSTRKNDPTAFKCEIVKNATAKYSCSEYGNDYKLNGTKCTKTYTETINATKK